MDFQQAPAVRADLHLALQDGADGEAAAHELEVGERRRVRLGGEVVQHGVPGPAQPAGEAVARPRHTHPPQVGLERIAGDADATLEVGDAQSRVAGEDGEGADVGLDPPLPR